MTAQIITPRSRPETLLPEQLSGKAHALYHQAQASTDPITARMLYCLAAQLARMQQMRARNANA